MDVIRGTAAALERLGERRSTLQTDARRSTVERVVADVRDRGDEALREYGRRFDGVDLEHVEIDTPSLDALAATLDDELRAAIDLSITRVRAFHERQPSAGFMHHDGDGRLGQLVRPIARVGCYVPSGKAALFSSLVMTAVPAQVAGVEEVVVATPPRHDGSIDPAIAYVVRALSLGSVYRLGGAQAIAALAYGTESVRRVDTIVGPGSPWVVIAQQLVFGQVGIESLPGPTETLVIADADADPTHVAADLLAQAEHDGAQVVLVTTSEALWGAVEAALERSLADLPSAPVARENMAARGVVAIVDDLASALEVSNAYAPEHLCLLVRDPWAALEGVRHAGGVFVGEASMEALGDYVAGPSHVMPTGGTARFSSALNVRHFQRVIPVIGLAPAGAAAIGEAGARMARAEGLEAHARAIEARAPRGDG
ncbi:histidinol dehydrogenase [soil metagenome]